MLDKLNAEFTKSRRGATITTPWWATFDVGASFLFSCMLALLPGEELHGQLLG